MDAIIFTEDDEPIGIQPRLWEIEEIVSDDFDLEDREFVRNELFYCFSNILGEQVKVIFSDELA